jgi:membrane-associated protease RseP (regulator of RpoE activity)
MNDSPPVSVDTGDDTGMKRRREPIRRRVKLPLLLFLLTCLSTFWSGATGDLDGIGDGSLMPVRAALARNWQIGLMYMSSVIGILLCHEMGHFLTTVRYRIPASFPFFLPIPISFIGTMGAVIGMDGRRANRKEIFDIGLAGPLAGLVIAIPVMWLGISNLELSVANGKGGMELQMPLLANLMASQIDVTLPDKIPLGHLVGNPLLLAGWFGFLITGLNMMPVGQLDGGHVLYCVLGPKARYVARLMMLTVIVYILSDLETNFVWILMTLLVIFLIGVDHPPTQDDSVDIGWGRRVIGTLSLAIPILCLPPTPFHFQ